MPVLLRRGLGGYIRRALSPHRMRVGYSGIRRTLHTFAGSAPAWPRVGLGLPVDVGPGFATRATRTPTHVQFPGFLGPFRVCTPSKWLIPCPGCPLLREARLPPPLALGAAASSASPLARSVSPWEPCPGTWPGAPGYLLPRTSAGYLWVRCRVIGAYKFYKMAESKIVAKHLCVRSGWGSSWGITRPRAAPTWIWRGPFSGCRPGV